jgi:hypothetical protein
MNNEPITKEMLDYIVHQLGWETHDTFFMTNDDIRKIYTEKTRKGSDNKLD